MEILFTKDKLPYAAYTVAVVTEQTKRVNFKFVENLPLGAAQDTKNGITGNATLAFFLAKFAASKQLPSGSVLSCGIENPSAEETGVREAQVQQWLEFAAAELSGQDLASLDKPAQYLNYVLQNSSFLTGNRLTVADLVVYEALKINKQTKSVFVRFNDKKAKRNVYDLQRWFTFLDQFVERHLAVLVDAQKKKVGTLEIIKILEEEQIKKQKQAKQQKTLGSGELEGDVDLVLPYVSLGNVVTRFPPEPSGFLHIGHAKAAMLNNFFANKYGGKVLLRFDDTNPAKEKSEYEEAIKEDSKKLKIQSASLTYTSDYFGKLVELAEQMLKAGKAYVDDTPREQFKHEKFEGIESKNRNNSLEKNLQMWEEVKKGTEYGRQCVLRAKIDMKHENKTMRDPVMFRCKPEHHARTGDSFKCYPTYDFACPVVDSVEGVTHALRTSEYNDRNVQYYWFIDALGIRKPYLWDYSRMGFEYTVMSKRKLQKLVDINAVDGWDDPRFPTVQGLLRRGLTIEALTKFVLDQGASRNSATLEWNKLWVFNKQIIDPVVPRFTALDAESLVPFEIADGPAEIEIRQVPKHKKNASLGVKNVQYSKVIYFDAADANAIEEGEEVTVMDWGNAIVKKVIKESGKVVKLEGVLNLKGSVKTTKKKLTWLAATDNLVDVETVFYGQLLNKKKVEKGDNFDDLINKKSKLVTSSKGDPNLKDLKKGEIIQLERRGYFICDVPYNPETKKLILFNIPDGGSTSIEAQKQ